MDGPITATIYVNLRLLRRAETGLELGTAEATLEDMLVAGGRPLRRQKTAIGVTRRFT